MTWASCAERRASIARKEMLLGLLNGILVGDGRGGMYAYARGRNRRTPAGRGVSPMALACIVSAPRG
jgi:hypothetical protein